MEKKWFILYTKPGTEKKVVASLAKKRIEHYLPMCYKGGDNNMTGKRAKEPLFEGYVFVETTADEIAIIRGLTGLSMMYWKNSPVIVPEREINLIKEYVSVDGNIMIKKIRVNRDECRNPTEFSSLVFDKVPFDMAHTIHQTVLPSLGYMLTATINKPHVTVIGKNRVISNRKSLY
ncbi:MAG: UpxY family transcription antiterminator [Chitinophagaceae bacterium]|nr:UpxY family transcription antiterminator [Chitinophagaceae bacterium]